MKISGWSKFPFIEANVSSPNTFDDLLRDVKKGASIARGNGRSYGDSSINIENTIDMKKLNRIISFDPSTGQLTSQSGILLADIIKIFLPKGWFPLVTPGSKYVTLGGMVAADVHGKNHHKDGSFRNCVVWIDLMLSTGEIKRCSRSENKDLFNWTIGGMGLTGIIINVSIKLKSVSTKWIKQKTISTNDFDETMEKIELSLNSTYSVAWIDCLATEKKLGRALIYTGEHASPNDIPIRKRGDLLTLSKKKKFRLFFNLPSFVLNKYFVKIFNSLFYFFGKQKVISIVEWDKFFYQLDSIGDWNNIYGSKGFAQFQCVIPLKYSNNGIRDIIKIISSSGSGAFLAVLKRFGLQDGYFSFPMEGYTLALDFPINNKNLKLLNHLDEIVIKYEGRFNLSKDSRMSANAFYRSESRLKNFIDFRNKNKKTFNFSSEQSKRLKI